ncbi:MAG TPA: (Fe-S)-binding protein, partial [Candidatus Rifleibacterium sp.]|nr:(Fe-S)-binding protein [Candidatus Rifleibacterium sp.]
QSRFFPLPGGLTRTAQIGSDSLSAEIVAVSGHAELRQIFEMVGKKQARMFIEPLFCAQGCVNGPGAPEHSQLFLSRNDIISYAEKNPGNQPGENQPDSIVDARYLPEEPAGVSIEITEEAINKVLAATGKTSPTDELNCGACGYNSCRDKAIAVIRGFAEIDMCIPYMRRLAEQRTDRIIETSPNGIVMLDAKLTIISMNPAFRKMFLCSEAVLGKHISYLIDPEAFAKVLSGSENLIEQTVNHQRYNLIVHQIIYQLETENQLVGIFVNITGSRRSIEQLAQLRSKTILQAREMLEHQVKMAQEMAKYLGESTAQGESIVENLLKLTESDDDGESRRKGPEWDIFTSK